MKYIVTESQYNLLVESLDKLFSSRGFTPRFVRRLVPMLKTVQDDLDWGVIDEIDPCQFSSVGEFIEESCDMLKDIYIDSINDMVVDNKDKDELYYHFLHKFSPYLHKVYHQRCAGGNLTEDHSDKFKKYLFNYLNSFDLVKQKQGPTSFIYSPRDASNEYEWAFMVWDEDYIDENGDIVRLRRLDVESKLYFTILGLFNISKERLNELILNWFNETYNENANDFILKNQD
jgi:hypothetical protein